MKRWGQEDPEASMGYTEKFGGPVVKGGCREEVGGESRKTLLTKTGPTAALPGSFVLYVVMFSSRLWNKENYLWKNVPEAQWKILVV